MSAANLRAPLDNVRSSFARMESVGAGPEGLNIVLWSDQRVSERWAGEAAKVTAGPLASAPVAIKDNIATLELPTTCASRILEGYVSPYEATAVVRLREAGAVVVGRRTR
jgi:aspartyl-tRNA(Asn)/glutamyl-tRNA(Gln) amidotransferase subunit A